MSVSDMPKMTFYKGKYGRTGKMTPRSARRVIKKFVNKKFTRRVQKIVDRSLKNTVTNVIKKSDSICAKQDNISKPQWFVFTPGVDVFRRPSGSLTSTTVNYPFEGESIKIKKWWIKGSVAYQSDLLTTVTIDQSEVGYVDLYLARRQFGMAQVPADLTDWYQSGHDNITPVGKREELLWPVNKNKYKIYAHKRFKMGGSWVKQNAVPAASLNEQNNDFSYARNFSFDVTKYVCKDRRIRYNAEEEEPQDEYLGTMCVVAIFHPACGDLTMVTGITGIIYRSAFSIDACSWGEYETA